MVWLGISQAFCVNYHASVYLKHALMLNCALTLAKIVIWTDIQESI